MKNTKSREINVITSLEEDGLLVDDNNLQVILTMYRRKRPIEQNTTFQSRYCPSWGCSRPCTARSLGTVQGYSCEYHEQQKI